MRENVASFGGIFVVKENREMGFRVVGCVPQNDMSKSSSLVLANVTLSGNGVSIDVIGL